MPWICRLATYMRDSNIGTVRAGGRLRKRSLTRYPTWLSGSFRSLLNFSNLRLAHFWHLSSNKAFICFTQSRSWEWIPIMFPCRELELCVSYTPLTQNLKWFPFQEIEDLRNLKETSFPTEANISGQLNETPK